MAKIAPLIRGIIETAKPNLETFVKYAKVELVPPTPKELAGVGKGIKNIMTSAKTGKWKQMSVREAWLNLLVATEVTLWFFIGECIGKRNLIGYKIEV